MSRASVPVTVRTATPAQAVRRKVCVDSPEATLRVLVVGQGYVGLPVAVRAAEAGHVVSGYDSDRSRTASLARGCSPIGDVSSVILGQLLQQGRYLPVLHADDVGAFDVAVIAVPTPLADGVPDLSHLVDAGRLVGRRLRPGNLVVLESTSYPGTTRTVLGRCLEEASGLRMGEDFCLGFSPERIDPGNPLWTLRSTPKIVSGVDSRSLERTAEFYSGLVDVIVPVARCEEAELAKIVENTFRAVNIALVNELAQVCRDTGLDLLRALDAASTKPFGYMRFDPGPGVGGHCLPIDPVYLSWWAARERGHGSRMIDLACDINAARPSQVAGLIAERLDHGESGGEVLLLGLAYKPGSNDLRQSPAVEVARLLSERGTRVSVADPHLRSDDLGLRLPGVRLVEANREALEKASLVVVLTDHDEFDYDLIVEASSAVLDCRGRLAGVGSARIEQL